MTLARWSTSLPLVLALAGAFSGFYAAVAAVKIPAMDGALPVYPNATVGDSFKAKAPPAAEWAQLWAHGFETELFSKDDPAEVDSWYNDHLQNYARRSNGSHARYSGKGGSVGVMATAGTKLAPYGKTVIVFDPN